MATLGTFVSGQVLSAAELNDIGTWTTFTPVFANLTVGSATIDAKYCQINDFVAWYISLVWAADTSCSGTISVDFPFEAAEAIPAGFSGFVGCIDATSSDYFGQLFRKGSTDVYPMVYGATSTYVNNVGINATVPFTWTTNDTLVISGFYEKA